MENSFRHIGSWSVAANELSEGLSDITLEGDFRSLRQYHDQHAYDRERSSENLLSESEESESHFASRSMTEPRNNQESSGPENGRYLLSSSLSFLSVPSTRGRLEAYLDQEQRHEQIALGVPLTSTSEYHRIQSAVRSDVVENGRIGQLQSPVSLTSSKELVQWGSGGYMSASQDQSSASQDLGRLSCVEVDSEVGSHPPDADEAIDSQLNEVRQSLSSSSRSQGKHGVKRRAYRRIRERTRKQRKTE